MNDSQSSLLSTVIFSKKVRELSNHPQAKKDSSGSFACLPILVSFWIQEAKQFNINEVDDLIDCSIYLPTNQIRKERSEFKQSMQNAQNKEDLFHQQQLETEFKMGVREKEKIEKSSPMFNTDNLINENSTNSIFSFGASNPQKRMH